MSYIVEEQLKISFKNCHNDMARIARIIVPEYPHHIIQRGNRSQNVFFNDKDKEAYLDFLYRHTASAGISIWAYCLMDNHVHLIAVPENKDSFARGIGEIHRLYTRMINFRYGWRGYLWQGRFISYVLDEQYLYAAIRYIERNPVRARLVRKAEDYPWSSAKAHILKQNNKILSDNFLLSEIEDWSLYLTKDDRKEDINSFMYCARTGRPLGNEDFLTRLEELTGRIIRKKRPGPKRN